MATATLLIQREPPSGLTPEGAREPTGAPWADTGPAERRGDVCAHCGASCGADLQEAGALVFCCAGCRTVYQILQEAGLGRFYELAERPGPRMASPSEAGPANRFCYLDEPEVRTQLIEFEDAGSARVTLSVPAIHCIACVWLLENLFRLRPGIGRSVVNLPRREVSVTFRPDQVRLSDVAGLLAAIGYEPSLHLAVGQGVEGRYRGRRTLWVQLGVAGFAFGNTMLFSMPGYLGLDAATGPGLKPALGWASLVLALPVLVYSARDYWRSAWLGWRQRMVTIDLPIALGLAALFGQSAWEVFSGRGEGYLDSLTGLVFFLLCGRLFQQRTYDRWVFDRDYRSFFPLAVRRREPEGEAVVPLARVAVGDLLLVRHGELIPADARLRERGASRRMSVPVNANGK